MLDIMTKISIFLNVNILTINPNRKGVSKQVYTIEVPAINKLEIIVDYFDKYPLIGIKYLDYSDWKGKEAYYLVKSKDHLTLQGREQIKL